MIESCTYITIIYRYWLFTNNELMHGSIGRIYTEQCMWACISDETKTIIVKHFRHYPELYKYLNGQSHALAIYGTCVGVVLVETLI